MKKNNTWLISIFAVFILLLSACNNTLNNQIEKNLDSADNKTATLYFSVNGASARNILPDTSLENFSDFVLTGVLNGTTHDLGSWETVQDMLDASVDIAAGSWNFNLSAKRGEVNFTASTQLTIEENQSAVASFVLRASETDAGTLKLNLTYPATPDLYKVTWYLSPVSNASSVEGFCKRDSSTGAESQTLSDTEFTLQKELPAGKYMLSCDFGILYAKEEYGGQVHEMCSSVGNYYDYVVIQPGFESALNYEIDYFELTGITNAVSTEEGMVLTLDVPKGSQKITIMRVKNMSNAQISSPEEATPLYSVITKTLPSPTTSHQTFAITDCYGYSKDDELTYGVYFDEQMNSLSSVIKTFIAEHDALPTPGFTTYPEFATESAANGQTTKLKVTNTPVLDNDDNKDYKIYFGFDENSLFLEPVVVFDKNTKEFSFNNINLAPGPQRFMDYRYGFEVDGWMYNLHLDTTGLADAQLPPVIQGPPPATATENGILIRVKLDSHTSCYVSLLRATSPQGPWSTLKSFTYVYDYFEYLDKNDLTEEQTYYYKLVDENDNTYGGEYFSATSIVTKGPLVSMTTAPTLTVNGTVATITSGSYEYDQDVKINDIRIEFIYANETDPTRKISVIRRDLEKPKEYEWKYSEEYPDEYDEDLTESISSREDSIDLYKVSIDGEKYIFSNAYVRFLDDFEMLYELPFTPAEGTYPLSIQIPAKRIQLSAEPTDAGIVLTVSNIPAGTEEGSYERITIYTSDANGSTTNIFNISDITQSSVVVTDEYVNKDNDYSYYARVNNDYHNKSPVVNVKASGGFGDFALTANYTDAGVILELPAHLETNDTLSIYKINQKMQQQKWLYLQQNTSSITDIFVNPDTMYYYGLSDISKNGSSENCEYWYYPRYSYPVVSIPADSSLKEFELVELPAAEFNQEEKSITFTAPPQFNQDLPTGYEINYIYFYYKQENDEDNIASVMYMEDNSYLIDTSLWQTGTYNFENAFMQVNAPNYCFYSEISADNSDGRMPQITID